MKLRKFYTMIEMLIELSVKVTESHRFQNSHQRSDIRSHRQNLNLLLRKKRKWGLHRLKLKKCYSERSNNKRRLKKERGVSKNNLRNKSERWQRLREKSANMQRWRK